MAADRNDVAFLDQIDLVREVREEELPEHRLDLGVADDAGFWVAQKQAFDSGGVVRLHMGDEQVIQFPPAEGVCDVLKEYFIHGFVNRVKQDCFFIQKEI